MRILGNTAGNYWVASRKRPNVNPKYYTRYHWEPANGTVNVGKSHLRRRVCRSRQFVCKLLCLPVVVCQVIPDIIRVAGLGPQGDLHAWILRYPPWVHTARMGSE